MNNITSEMLLRKIRQKVFDYPETKNDQVARVIDYLKARVQRSRVKESTGIYSGLTRKELNRAGLCETDFY